MNIQTPLERLKAEQQRLQSQCCRERKILAEEWTYINENSGRLMLWGIRELVFPQHRKVQAGKTRVGFMQNVLNNLPYYVTIIRENFSIIWLIVRPLYLKWKKARR